MLIVTNEFISIKNFSSIRLESRVVEAGKSRDIMDKLLNDEADIGLADFSINYYSNNERLERAVKLQSASGWGLPGHIPQKPILSYRLQSGY